MNIGPDRGESSTILFIELNHLSRDATGDNVANFTHLRFILQVTARDVERQVWSVKTTLQGCQKLRDQFGAAVTDKDLITEELDVTFRHIELVVQLGEIENPFQVKGKIDIEVNPEKRFIRERVEFAIELLVIFITELSEAIRVQSGF